MPRRMLNFWDAVEKLIGFRATDKIYYAPSRLWLATRHWLIYYKIMKQPKDWGPNNRRKMRPIAKRRQAIATFIVIMWITAGFTFATVYFFQGHILTPTATLPDDSGSVVCGAAFLYNDKLPYSEETLVKLEALAKTTCKDSKARTTTNHRHPNGDLKHAVLIGGEVCTINWQLTPEAHKTAFSDVCLNKQP